MFETWEDYGNEGPLQQCYGKRYDIFGGQGMAASQKVVSDKNLDTVGICWHHFTINVPGYVADYLDAGAGNISILEVQFGVVPRYL